MRRFWTRVQVEPLAGGLGLQLDDRPILTPSKARLIVPTRKLAEAIAAEWRGVGARVVPRAMPFTRAANAAVDRVAPSPAPLAQGIAEYGRHDLLCYRAATPPELLERQRQGWDPLLDWAATALNAPLHVTTGITPIPQPKASLAALATRTALCDPFALTALGEMVSLSGSLILGLAVIEARLLPEAAWAVAQIDDGFQTERWGADDEAQAAARLRRTDFLQAFAFWRTLQGAP